jgi:hypothetical protein
MVYKLTSKQTLECLESVRSKQRSVITVTEKQEEQKQKHNVIRIIDCCLSPDKSIVSISCYHNAVDFGDLPYR